MSILVWLYCPMMEAPKLKEETAENIFMCAAAWLPKTHRLMWMCIPTNYISYCFATTEKHEN